MKNEIKEFFKREKIEYFNILAYKDVRETNPNIMARESFVPKSVIIYVVPYYGTETVNISRYAASYDYHLFIRGIGERLIDFLKGHFAHNSYHSYGDHSPIDERHAALIAGLGILGDNGLLINEKYGSYIFIGDVVTDIPPEKLGAAEPQEIVFCEHCGICKRSCPTKILFGEGCECLSAITQTKGELGDAQKALMVKYNTVWGCDECQRHCPHNRDPQITPIDFFHENTITNLTHGVLDGMTKEEFKKRAFSWRGEGILRRNLDIVSSRGESGKQNNSKTEL